MFVVPVCCLQCVVAAPCCKGWISERRNTHEYRQHHRVCPDGGEPQSCTAKSRARSIKDVNVRYFQDGEPCDQDGCDTTVQGILERRLTAIWWRGNAVTCRRRSPSWAGVGWVGAGNTRCRQTLGTPKMCALQHGLDIRETQNFALRVRELPFADWSVNTCKGKIFPRSRYLASSTHTRVMCRYNEYTRTWYRTNEHIDTCLPHISWYYSCDISILYDVIIRYGHKMAFWYA